MKKLNSKILSGFTLVEVVIACSIISIVLFALLSVAEKGLKLSTLALKQAQASYILEEGAEAVKSIRDASWTNISSLSNGTTYYLYYNITNNVWTLNTSTTAPSGYTPDTPIDDTFTRTIVFSPVYRNSSTDDIASSGDLDVRTKKVTVTVSWPYFGATASKDLSFYLIDIFN